MALGLALSQVVSAAEDPVIAAYRQGDIDGAFSASQSRITKDANDAVAHYYLGLCLLKKNETPSALEQFNWVMLHSVDPELRAAADKSLQLTRAAASARASSPHAAAAQAASSQAASSHTASAQAAQASTLAGRAAPATAATVRTKEAPFAEKHAPPGSRVGHEFTETERAIEQTRARIMEQKLEAMRKAQQECAEIDRQMASDTMLYWNNNSYDAFRRATMRRNDAERRKREIMSAARQRSDAWDDALKDLTDQLEHPGKHIQLVPKNVSPYVKSFMNTGESEDDLPPEVVPLRATPQKYGVQPKKP